MSTGDRGELYTQILPLDGDRILIPASAVGEVLNLSGMTLATGSPGWYLGSKRWAGRDLPVISLEGLCGRPVPPRSTRSRIVILRTATGREMGVVCQGQPHLAPVNERALTPSGLAAMDPEQFVLARLRIANLSAFVPDLDAIAKVMEKAQLAQQASQAPAWAS